MDVVQTKYVSFQKFLLEIDCRNDWIVWLPSVNLNSFLMTLKDKYSAKMSIDEIYKSLIETAKIENDKVTPHEERVKRYISYFVEIVKVLN